MYAIYEKISKEHAFRYRFKKKVSLFGCNSGYIPFMLKQILRQASTEPFPWHVNIESALESIGQSNQVLIINLKPNSSKPNLSLYELIDVWGYSSSGWTPVMFYMIGLFVDENPNLVDDKNFTRLMSEVEDPIFSMTYLSGTVINGRIQGRWTPPGPSPTNSVLLWPDTFQYFAKEAKKIMNSKA